MWTTARARTRTLLTLAVTLAAFYSASCGCKNTPPVMSTGPSTEVNEPGATGTGPGKGSSPPGEAVPMPASRTALLSSESANYDRFEGTSFENACGSDGDCKVSGCSAEVCAAEEVVTTCDVPMNKPAGNCGCVEGSCIWFTP